MTILSPLGFATQKGATRDIATTINLVGAAGIGQAGNVSTVISTDRKMSLLGFTQQPRNFTGKGTGNVTITLTGAEGVGQAEAMEGAHVTFYPDGAEGLGQAEGNLAVIPNPSPGQHIYRTGAMRDDLALWDGNTKTVDRLDETGGKVTKLTVGEFVDVAQIFGGDQTVATIKSMKTFLGTDKNVTLLWTTGKWLIDEDVTVPDNFANHIPAGCVFEINTGKTLTFDGPVNVEFSANWYIGTVVCSVGARGFPGW